MHNTIDITLENFQQVILEQSQQKYILVEFWAPNLEQCEQLSATLSAMAPSYAAHLIYARVNCEQQQQIAAQFGIRSLPTVILVKDGQPIDGFAGLQGSGQIEDMLNKHLPSAEDGLYEKAVQLISEGDYQNAFTVIKQAHDLNKERKDILLVLADCYVEMGNSQQAKSLLETVGLADQNGYYHSIVGKIELAEQAAESPEIKQLQQQLADDPDNMSLKVELAIKLHQANQTAEALALLYSVLVKDLSFGDAKKFTLDIINALPDGEPLKSQYRRKIYGLLY
jgi:putative thioredoxin